MPRRPVSGSGGKGRYRVRQTPRKENRLAQWYQKYGYVRHRHKPASSQPKETPLFFECFPYVCPEPVLVKMAYI